MNFAMFTYQDLFCHLSQQNIPVLFPADPVQLRLQEGKYSSWAPEAVSTY